MKIKGVYTALVTPFTGVNNTSVNYTVLKENIRFQLESGISGLVPLGTTGETPTLTKEEQIKIINCTVSEAKGKAVILVGTGTNSTASTIENTLRAKDLGADAALIVTPYYNKPTQEGLYRHFAAVAEAADLPLVVYNIKGRSCVNIETATMSRLAKIPQVVAVKEASGDIGQIGDVVKELASDKFSVMSGDDGLTLPAMALGAAGVVSVLSNLLPKEVVTLVSAAASNDITAARKIHYHLLPLFKAIFIETNPIPIKAAMNLCGIPCGGHRLPLCEMKQENLEKLISVLQELKIIKGLSNAV